MALGDITQTVDGQAFLVELLASVTAANGKPTANAGISTSLLRQWGQAPSRVRVAFASTAGSGTMTVTGTVWGKAGGIWFILKALNASSAAPHTAVAIPESAADVINFSDIVEDIAGCDRLFLEVVAIAGTSTAVTGYVLVGRELTG